MDEDPPNFSRGNGQASLFVNIEWVQKKNFMCKRIKLAGLRKAHMGSESAHSKYLFGLIKQLNTDILSLIYDPVQWTKRPKVKLWVRYEVVPRFIQRWKQWVQ